MKTLKAPAISTALALSFAALGVFTISNQTAAQPQHLKHTKSKTYFETQVPATQ